MILLVLDPHDPLAIGLIAWTWLAWWPICGLLILSALVIAWRAGRAADCPALVIAACLTAMGTVLARLIVRQHAAEFATIYLITPSGHTSLGLVAYAGLVIVGAADLTAPARRLVAVAGALVMTGVIVGLFLLGFHTGPDILVGGVIGIASLLISRVIAAPLAAAMRRTLRE